MDGILSYKGYSLVFEDGFDGPALDQSRWNVELHPPGWVNEELQEYVDSRDTITLEDSKLLIRPVKTVHRDGSVSYTSGRISTQHKYDFTYGLFEARLKVPQGKGYLPAFWLMTTDEDRYGQWPECGEIDIMEILGDRTKTNHGTIHYGLPHQQSQGTVTLDRGDFSEEFHDFALLWEPGRLRWYVDSRQFYETSQWRSAGQDGQKKPFPAPFDHDMYVILNLAVGGNWVGYPDETTDFEHTAFEVDYVRIYQKKP
ncbi:glycoside hydrolase family 16 protein [uncultured Oscillibacter sp.]|uniref:glycoside hydrolase family 16 protein n=1 Tax=uncultured Oscillibacter sp. TaxID=876091 RepID=UPI00262F636B|nr:glycoside hydrolase family 16 protein [uncultured Oscillibacter sp.]